MTTITRLESKTADNTSGGLWIHFDSGLDKLVQWESRAPIHPTREAAEKYVQTVIADLWLHGRESDVRETNWVSVTAMFERCLAEWNIRLIEGLMRDDGGLAGETGIAVH